MIQVSAADAAHKRINTLANKRIRILTHKRIKILTNKQTRVYSRDVTKGSGLNHRDTVPCHQLTIAEPER